MARHGAVGAVLSVARQRAVDEPFVHAAHGLVVRAQPFDRAGLEAFHEHVGAGGEVVEHLPCLCVLEVEDDAALVAAQRVEGGLADFVGARPALTAHTRGRLHHDDVGTHVGERHGAERPRGPRGEVDDLDVVEGKHGGARIAAPL